MSHSNGEDSVGEAIPPLTAHAVSVSLPTWRANVGYEKGERWVVARMKTGYPRFFIHKSIELLESSIVSKYGQKDCRALIFPSNKVAQHCASFLRKHEALDPGKLHVAHLAPGKTTSSAVNANLICAALHVVFFPRPLYSTAKQFWQHTGEGISSRRAEYCLELFKLGFLAPSSENHARLSRGPRRYSQKPGPENGTLPPPPDFEEPEDLYHYVEERFGRNLQLSSAGKAKAAVRRRIAGSLKANVDLEQALDQVVKGRISEEDIYLYPTGMSAIYNTHRTLLAAKGCQQSISFGFPYIDTLKVLQKFGPGCIFYGRATSDELDHLEDRLGRGEKYLALFCEFPSNPLLRTPDLQRIRQLADKFDFAVVIDETIGNFLNIHVLPHADVVVSSLTKIFSGDSNVMGGSVVLNPNGKYYAKLKAAWSEEYEDNYWPQDAIFMERNSRDFVRRIDRININAESICEVLQAHPKVKNVYYPKCCVTRALYDRYRTPSGGYGGLLSVTFHSPDDAKKFYDILETAKGPSLGTNFTLSSPYVILAHYNELPWAASLGVEAELIRFSVGLEEPSLLGDRFRKALNYIL